MSHALLKSPIKLHVDEKQILYFLFYVAIIMLLGSYMLWGWMHTTIEKVRYVST